jgi:hypothetical protein
LLYFFAVVSAVVTGGLCAVAAQVLGVRHTGVVVAIGVIAGGAELLALVCWYLYRTRE